MENRAYFGRCSPEFESLRYSQIISFFGDVPQGRLKYSPDVLFWQPGDAPKRILLFCGEDTSVQIKSMPPYCQVNFVRQSPKLLVGTVSLSLDTAVNSVSGTVNQDMIEIETSQGELIQIPIRILN